MSSTVAPRCSGEQNWCGSDAIGELVAFLVSSSLSLSVNPPVFIVSAFPRNLKRGYSHMRNDEGQGCHDVSPPPSRSGATPASAVRLWNARNSRTAFPCFSAIVHANPSLETHPNRMWVDVGVGYRNRDPDTRHHCCDPLHVCRWTHGSGGASQEDYAARTHLKHKAELLEGVFIWARY